MMISHAHQNGLVAAMSDSPMVTVIMPVRDEASFIAKSLGAVLAQDYPAHLIEIIVADGMSTDGTREAIAARSTADPRVRLLNNHGKIVSTGLNAALSHALGAVIVLVGGHCVIAPDYVRRCVDHLLNQGVDGVGGPLETVGHDRIGGAIAAAMATPFGVGGAAFRTSAGPDQITDTVPFAAYRRATMDRAGPFDEELVRNQDDEFNYRLRALGGKLLLASDVRSVYYSRGSLISLGRQYFQYGYWKVRVTQKHPRQMRPRHFIPPVFVATLLAAATLAPFAPGVRFARSVVSASYGLANIAASVATARHFGWRYLPYLPLIYATLHFSYGLGYLVGLVKFGDRWR